MEALNGVGRTLFCRPAVNPECADIQVILVDLGRRNAFQRRLIAMPLARDAPFFLPIRRSWPFEHENRRSRSAANRRPSSLRTVIDCQPDCRQQSLVTGQLQISRRALSRVPASDSRLQLESTRGDQWMKAACPGRLPISSPISAR